MTSRRVYAHAAGRGKCIDKQIMLSDRLAAFISTPRDLRPFVSLQIGQGDGEETGQKKKERATFHSQPTYCYDMVKL